MAFAAGIARGVWRSSSFDSDIPIPVRCCASCLAHDFNDSTHPLLLLSPDGRMLTFIRGGAFGDSAARGEAVREAPASRRAGPAHAGSSSSRSSRSSRRTDRASCTRLVTQRWKWDLWQVPVLGGAPQPFLPNGVRARIWLDERQLDARGDHEGRPHGDCHVDGEPQREHGRIDLPSGENGMAHRSAPSPIARSLSDRGNGRRRPGCPGRVDAVRTRRQPGRPVGPPNAQCTTAARAARRRVDCPVSSNAETGFHIWRQRLPDGVPSR